MCGISPFAAFAIAALLASACALGICRARTSKEAPDEPRVPVVAAHTVITGRDYDDLLEEYESWTPEQQAMTDEVYNRDNMGYGPEAWQEYLAAESEQEAARQEQHVDDDDEETDVVDRRQPPS